MKLADLKINTPEQKLVIDNAIGLVRTGSYLYGSNTKDSDMDYVGFFVAPEEYKLGRKKIEIVEFRSNKSSSGKRNTKEDTDCTFYEISKWFDLLCGNSPNQLELLFVNNGNKIFTTDIFEKILSNRALFLSKKLKHSFSGYAYSQIKKNELKSGNQTGRIELIEKYGYDTKLASHVVRLYTECLDLLTVESVEFPLRNNKEILDIKNGLITYEEFQKRCAFLEPLIEKAYIESKLQYAPDYEKIHKLQIELYNKYYKLMVG